ncbi:MAG: DUF3108 domain-containing protein [Caulobacteraceae bacterium]|nr:DUF3108 domain-containing protein [Caulobacteraceae bacterium]
MKFRAGLLGVVALIVSGAPGVKAEPARAPVKLVLDYDGKLLIKVLDIEFVEDMGQNAFSAGVRMRSYGVLALFKRFDIQAEAQGRFQAGDARPSAFHYLNHDGKRVRDVRASWGDDDVVMTSTPAFGNLGQPPASREQKLAAADPLTQMIRMATAASPCGAERRFFDGKQLYSLTFGPAQTGALSDDERALGLVNPMSCTVRYQEIAGFKAKPPAKRNQGLQGPIMAVMGQLGAGGPWVFTSMSADTPLGKARIVLHGLQQTPAR